jgi:hypothetical protein
MRKAFRMALPLAAVLIAPVHAEAGDQGGGWRDWLDCEKLNDSSVKHCETLEREWKATGRPIVVDSSPNGGVVVIGWDRDVVQVKAVVHARGTTQAAAEEIAERIDVTMDPDRISATGPSDRGWSVSFIVHAPLRSDLDLRAENGPVEVEGVTGALKLATRNGPISIDGVGGDVRAVSQNGPLHVRLTGRGWVGKGLDAETQNGPVQVVIPSRYSAVLESGTRNGPMDVELPVRIRRGQYFTTELGSGGTPLRIVTRNGPVSIRRGQPASS